MEKKIEVEIDGKIVRIMPHMLEDSVRFGASTLKRQSRKVPDELLNIPAKPIIQPDVKPSPDLKVDVTTKEVNTDPLESVSMETTKEPEVSVTKAPIKRRNTKKK